MTPGQISISGRRQTGRTEKMIWIVVGAILSDAKPAILTRTKADWDQTRARLRMALESVGYKSEEAWRLADKSCPHPSWRPHGYTFQLQEVDVP